MSKPKAIICPYCGDTQPNSERCRACGGLFEPLSRQATHNEMGPWFIRDVNRPFQPGCSYGTMVKLIERGLITKTTILRGPTTKQFWTIARRVPGISHLLGYCHNCDVEVDREDHGCYACGVPFGAYLDRNYLGLPEIRPLPWEAQTDEMDRSQPAPQPSRMSEFQRRTEPVGISSFASDAELLGAGLTAMPAPAPATTEASVLSGTAASTSSAVGLAPASSELAESPAPAADPLAQTIAAINAAAEARRQLQHQRRKMQGLLIGFVLVLTASIITLAVMLSREKGDQPADIQQEASPKQIEQPSASPSTPAYDVEAAMARVAELRASFSDDARTMQDRIAAGEEALALLNQAQAKAPANQKPADLAQQLETLQKELDDLRLKAYFP